MKDLYGILRLLIVLLLPCAVAGAQPGTVEEEEPQFFNYVQPWGKMPLPISTEKIGIRFEKGVSEAVQADILESQPAFDASAELSLGDNEGTIVVGLKEGTSTRAVLETLENLSCADGVYFASPVVEPDPGFPTLTTNEFYMSFQLPAPEDKIEALNKAQSVELFRKREMRSIGQCGYWLRTTKASAMNALAMSNLYYEELQPVNAGPNFICLYSILQAEPDDPLYEDQQQVVTQWYLPKINVPSAWDVVTGSEYVTVAVLDSGVDLNYGGGYTGHPDLNANQWHHPEPLCPQNDPYGWDFVAVPEDNVPTEEPPKDHGTPVAGIIAAVTNNATGVAGIAGGWATGGCKIMPVRVTPPGDPANEGRLTDGISYAAAHGANIISMSLTVSPSNSDVGDAIAEAHAAGCVLVAASGNYDDGSVRYPARFPEVIAVGALNKCSGTPVESRKYGSVSETDPNYPFPSCNPKDGGPSPLTAWGSDWGAELDVTAPGLQIWTTSKGGGYLTTGDCFSRTSSATPQVSGVAALVLAATLDPQTHLPTLSPTQVQAIIQFSATDMDYTIVHSQWTEDAVQGRDLYTGYGRVDAAAAVALAKAGRFVLRNAAGKHLASFDSAGNFVLEGSLTTYPDTTSGQLEPASNDKEFIVRHGAQDVLLLLKSTGDMYIKGCLYEKVSVDLDTAVSVDSFRIRDATGDTVAVINSQDFVIGMGVIRAGSILLKGRMFEGGDPDRLCSQGG